MDAGLNDKLRQAFSQMVIYKDSQKTESLFSGRTLPSFVKDFLLKRFISTEGEVDAQGLSAFLDKVMPQDSVKARLQSGDSVTLLTRFEVNIDLVRNVRRFAIPDLGIKMTEAQIPPHVYNQHADDLVDGERWGVITLCLAPDPSGRDTNVVEMTEYKPFKPYRSVDIDYYRRARSRFTTEEWLDVLLSAMEYEAAGFKSIGEKLEFLTRLLIFIEPRLNVIELAPKGTGKSYVFGNISKYGWLVSGGKVTRAKLFYDKNRRSFGLMYNHDFLAFDEVSSITFQEPSEIQSALKNYLESGVTTIDNNTFTSQCGLMLMGNIPLTADMKPQNPRYFESLSSIFSAKNGKEKDSALLERFHGFIEGWMLPRIRTGMYFRGWTLNIEYFSEILHAMRTESVYATLFDKLVERRDTDSRDYNAVKRLTTAYVKLLFPHWTSPDVVNKDEFLTYCLAPAVRRRGIIREQCHLIDSEFKAEMPEFRLNA